MNQKTLNYLIPFFILLISANKSLSQCDQGQHQPAGCLCIYFCTFSATANSCAVDLVWTTQTEPSPASSFEIWRNHSGQSGDWLKIATVAGNPGSTSPKTYPYTDNRPYNPDGGSILYYVKLIGDAGELSWTNQRSVQMSSNCSDPCPANTIVGFSSPILIGNTMQLSITDPVPSPISWSSSNSSVASISSSGLVTGLACGTTTITATNAVCGTSVQQTLTVNPALYTTCVNPSCNGIYSTSLLTANPGDVVVLRVSMNGYISWNGSGNGAGAAVSITATGVANSAATAHYYSSTGFSTSCDITITVSSSPVSITTTAALHNSSYSSSASAKVTVVSVNGVSKNNQTATCYGNSQGNW